MESVGEVGFGIIGSSGNENQCGAIGIGKSAKEVGNCRELETKSEVVMWIVVRILLWLYGEIIKNPDTVYHLCDLNIHRHYVCNTA